MIYKIYRDELTLHKQSKSVINKVIEHLNQANIFTSKKRFNATHLKQMTELQYLTLRNQGKHHLLSPAHNQYVDVLLDEIYRQSPMTYFLSEDLANTLYNTELRDSSLTIKSFNLGEKGYLSFSLSLPMGSSIDGLEVYPFMVILGQRQAIEEKLKEVNISKILHVGFDDDRHEALYIAVSIQEKRKLSLESSHKLSQRMHVSKNTLNHLPTFSPHEVLPKSDNDRLKIAIRLALSFALFKQSDVFDFVEGIPKDSRVMDSVMGKSITVKELGSQDGCTRFVNSFYRTLRHPRYYQGKYAEWEIGSRVIFIKGYAVNTQTSVSHSKK